MRKILPPYGHLNDDLLGQLFVIPSEYSGLFPLSCILLSKHRTMQHLFPFRSTIQLLRFPFSFFLMPVYWLAISIHPASVNITNAILIWIILHGLVYPSSNGYNSFMDRDTESIGGIKNPMQPTKHLFTTTIVMDIIAIIFSLFIHWKTALGILLYILVSKAYSYRRIRLKQYPVWGFITVAFFQGSFTLALVYYSVSFAVPPLLLVVAAFFMLASVYPLTQIYQFQADQKDGVTTISYLLGYRGTFIACGIFQAVSGLILYQYYSQQQSLENWFIFMGCMMPAIGFFAYWAWAVWRNTVQANFKNAMIMNTLASVCTNIAFIIIMFKSVD